MELLYALSLYKERPQAKKRATKKRKRSRTQAYIPASPEIPRGITLEIFPFSPSDIKHGFYFCEQEDDYPFRFEEDLIRNPDLATYHQQRASQVTPRSRPHRMQGRNLREEATRLYGTPLRLNKKALPRAPIVTSLLIRRQTCKSIEVDTLAQLLRQSFVCLQNFRLERRPAVSRLAGNEYQSQLADLLFPALPRSLRMLCISTRSQFKSDYFRYLRDSSTVIRELVSQCARVGLSELGLDEMHHLAYFFSSLKTGRLAPIVPLENLEYLCLRYVGLAYETELKDLDMAAEAMASIPKLKKMELWDTAPREACLFRYTVDRKQGQASITWRCTDNGGLRLRRISKADVKQWSQISQQHGCWQSEPLVLIIDPFPESGAEICQSDGCFILKYLHLCRLIADPITQAQIEAENTLITTGERLKVR